MHTDGACVMQAALYTYAALSVIGVLCCKQVLRKEHAAELMQLKQEHEVTQSRASELEAAEAHAAHQQFADDCLLVQLS